MKWVALVVEAQDLGEQEYLGQLCGVWAKKLEEAGIVAVVVGDDTPDGEAIVLAKVCTAEQSR